jgi:transcription initiation factor TFIIIB Brf1 subunit/transcription initiation factor TFIIB
MTPDAAQDALTSAKIELEAIRASIARDTEDKRLELERFKEDALWRLNAVSDRTIEIAAMEGKDVEARINLDWTQREAAIAEWRGKVERRLSDGDFIAAVADAALERLLPDESGEPGGGTP